MRFVATSSVSRFDRFETTPVSGVRLFRLNLEDQFGQTRLSTRDGILVPELTRGGAVEGARNAFELLFSRSDVAVAERAEQSLNTIANERARGAVAFTDNDVLSQSFFCALNLRHGNLYKNLSNNVFFKLRRGSKRRSKKDGYASTGRRFGPVS